MIQCESINVYSNFLGMSVTLPYLIEHNIYHIMIKYVQIIGIAPYQEFNYKIDVYDMNDVINNEYNLDDIEVEKKLRCLSSYKAGVYLNIKRINLD